MACTRSPFLSASPPNFSPWTRASKITSAGLRRPTAEEEVYTGVRDFNLIWPLPTGYNVLIFGAAAPAKEEGRVVGIALPTHPLTY